LVLLSQFQPRATTAGSGKRRTRRLPLFALLCRECRPAALRRREAPSNCWLEPAEFLGFRLWIAGSSHNPYHTGIRTGRSEDCLGLGCKNSRRCRAECQQVLFSNAVGGDALHHSGVSCQGRRMKGFGPIHRNPRSINDDPGLGFPGGKPITGVRLFLGTGPSWFRASPLRLQRRSPSLLALLCCLRTVNSCRGKRRGGNGQAGRDNLRHNSFQALRARSTVSPALAPMRRPFSTLGRFRVQLRRLCLH
jgi:hypothetical protein